MNRIPVTPLRRAMPWLAAMPLLAFGLCVAPLALADETINAYSIWPENWARPMFEEFEKATGIKVNFVRFSSGDRKSTRLNSSHLRLSRMPSSA